MWFQRHITWKCLRSSERRACRVVSLTLSQSVDETGGALMKLHLARRGCQGAVGWWCCGPGRVVVLVPGMPPQCRQPPSHTLPQPPSSIPSTLIMSGTTLPHTLWSQYHLFLSGNVSISYKSLTILVLTHHLYPPWIIQWFILTILSELFAKWKSLIISWPIHITYFIWFRS